jgi:hypothetical protein
MKRIVKTSLELLRASVTDKPRLGSKIIKSLTDNATVFDKLPIPLATLTTVNKGLNDANEEAESNATANRKHVINAEKEWNRVIKKTALYIDSVAEGNEEIIVKAGFTATKSETTVTTRNSVATNFSVEIEKGSKGAFIASCKAEAKAKAYVFVAADTEMIVTQNGDTLKISVGDKTAYIRVDAHRETEFTDLVNKKSLNVTVYSVNTAGSSPAAPSQEVTPQ